MKLIWGEDDCTTHDPVHETLEKAYKRITGEDYNKKDAKLTIDEGDGLARHMKNGLIVFQSFPGNSAIYDPTKE